MKMKCYCKICGKYIGEYYKSVTRDTCGKECYKKLVGINVNGTKNPNYRHGKNIENKCIDCGVNIDPRSKRCLICRGKAIPCYWKGKKLPKRIRLKIGMKSKAKFTKEYLERIKDKYRGSKKRSINGYILIRDYNHPDRNKQNDILEHRLVMEKDINRRLDKKEVIHHINFDRADNRIENLHLYRNIGEHGKCTKSLFKLVKNLLDKKIIIFKNGEYQCLI